MLDGPGTAENGNGDINAHIDQYAPEGRMGDRVEMLQSEQLIGFQQVNTEGSRRSQKSW